MTPAPLEDRRLAGIALTLLAVLLFTGIDSCAKWLIQAGLPPKQVVFVRFAAHVAIVLCVFWPREGRGLFRTENHGVLVLRGMCLLAGTVLNFLALEHLPLMLTSAIFFTMPLWICALSVPLLGEQVGPRRWAAVLVGFSGILIATQPWSGTMHWAVVYSVGAAVAAALYGILTRRLAGTDGASTLQAYAAGIAMLGVAPMAFADWTWPSLPVDWLAFALIGVFGWAGHQVLTVAHRFAPASVLAPFVYTQMVYMTLAGWVIFGSAPDLAVLAGAAVVLASGLYIWLRERQLAQASDQV
ncbi:MAG: DMT family transporter [Pseudomonadota bacterium]